MIAPHLENFFLSKKYLEVKVCYIFGIDDAAMATGLAGLFGAGANLAGGMMGAAGAQATNSANMAFNAQQAQLQREFEADMSSTAYRRAMTDMKAAGLNPILAGNLGGASTPGGAVASVNLQNPGASMQAGLAGVAQSIGNTAQYKASIASAGKDESASDVNKAQVPAIQATTDLTKSSTARTEQETKTSAAAEEAQRAAALSSTSNAAVNNATLGLIREQTNSAAAKAKIDALDLKDQEQFGVPRPGETLGTTARRIFRGVVTNPDASTITSGKGSNAVMNQLLSPKPRDPISGKPVR